MRLPSSAKNWVSLAGAMVALISLFMIVFLFSVTVLMDKPAAYLGLLVYILLPGFLLAGLIIIPLGMYLKIRGEKKAGVCAMPGWPRIDLNETHQRNAALLFITSTIFLLFLSAVGSYNAFEYTESVAFCGTLCHQVMKPENVAHQNSAHAKISCVACHVGPGVDWYVRSKLSGLYQVYAVTTDNFPRPIPTPIENLRPARAVCEQCHWPQKFYAQQYLIRSHYLQDRGNSRWDIGLALKIGPPETGAAYHSGIHWHVNPQVKIEYLPSDERRETLPWVRYTNLETGEIRVFQSEDNPQKVPLQNQASVRVMDCLDCHNRPSHRYRSPNEFLDLAFAAGHLPTDLPELKATAVQLCSQVYSTSNDAAISIQQGLRSLYQESYPEIWASRQSDIEAAIGVVQQSFARNIFPEMKVNWTAYPDHSGHKESPGCFRCHDGLHKTEAGEVISNDCQLCHLITEQGTPTNREYGSTHESLAFQHPIDIGKEWREIACTECHQE